MKVRERMSTNVLSVEMKSTVTECYNIMRDNNIRRLPVLEKGRLAGIVTLSDLDRAAPSAATSLSKNELNYLLAKLTLKDIIPKSQEVITIDPESYIETAAKLMRMHTVSGLPVVENGAVIGIITETDIFDAFIDILGVNKVHTRINIFTEDRLGTLAEITGIIAEKNKNILNALVYFDNKKDKYKINLRLEGKNCEDVIAELKKRSYDVEAVESQED
jgi:acetoin utilization protein AcuB